MKCPRCHNEDDSYFYQLNGRYYCRKCVGFARTFVDEELDDDGQYGINAVDFQLDFKLSPAQQEMSDALLNNYRNHQNTQIKAVCGAGKTEIVYQVLRYALNRGDRVCFAIPRKELVKELGQRIRHDFAKAPVTLLYGGHTKKTAGQFIICTTHQLYRYHHAFDLIVVDEIDAFPFKGDATLNALFFQALRGTYIVMSATAPTSDFELNRRFHGGKLPEPKCLKVFAPFDALVVLFHARRFGSSGRPFIIYVPSIAQTKTLARLVALLGLKCAPVHSQSANASTTIEALRDSSLDGIVATTLLERGITVENVQVIVYQGDHRIFTRDTLIQICGRVGRKPDHQDGEILILCNHRTEAIKQCIKAIEMANA